MHFFRQQTITIFEGQSSLLLLIVALRNNSFFYAYQTLSALTRAVDLY